MGKKQYFLTIDTETTIEDTVVDFGATITDRKGNILNECAILIAGIYKSTPLFYISGVSSDDFWSKEYMTKKYANYDNMLVNGSRMLATVPMINRWLARAKATYDPIMTAYNLAFDVSKMRNTGIDCDLFEKRFCLWKSASHHIARKKEYKQFALLNHYFTNKSPKVGAITVKTNAEAMTHFLTDNDVPEPHTSIEDVKDYELPILKYLLSKMSTAKMMSYDNSGYRDFQLKDHYKVK